MDKPTKIQRTIEFDSIEEEAYSVFSLEAAAALQGALDLLESYASVGRQDTEYLLMAIDDVRRKMYRVDLILGDANAMLEGRRDYLQNQASPPTVPTVQEAQNLEGASQVEQTLKSSLESLKSSLGTPKVELETDQNKKGTEK